MGTWAYSVPYYMFNIFPIKDINIKREMAQWGPLWWGRCFTGSLEGKGQEGFPREGWRGWAS